jgi:acetyl esterase/lipase
MRRGIGALILIAVMAAPFQARAQGPDGWTVYELNVRAAPNGAVIATVPANTGFIFEARNAELSWLLGHTQDSAIRGWVASGYCAYAEGFTATRLPISEEVVAAGSAPPPAAPPPEDSAGPLPDGTVESMTLFYETERSEYYRLTYWSDGLRINGFIGFPKTQGPHPAVIYNRGGMWNAGNLIGIEIVPLVETGYVAVASQYRGNAGSEGIESFGYGDVIDVMSLIPLLQAQPKVDPWRIGMMGGSRGALVTYMALKSETLTGQNRIRAAVTVGGITDLTMWYDQSPDFAEVLQIMVGPSPQAAPEQYQTRSAVFWPELISCPLLLLHGENDWIVSPDQSRKLHDKMKALSKDVTLIIYPGDDHPLTGQLGGYPEAVRWFNRYLGGTSSYEDNWGNIQAATQAIWSMQ